MLDFFSYKSDKVLRKSKHVSQRNTKSLFLLCLDNIEKMDSEGDEESLKVFLTELYDECPCLRILLTSGDSFSTLPANPVLKTKYVKQLMNDTSARLFFDLYFERKESRFEV